MTASNQLSAAAVVERLASGDLTAEALTRVCVDRAEERKSVKAWTWLDPEQALAQARAADRAGRPGLLAALPIGVKDIIVTVVVLIVFGIALVLVLNVYKNEGDKRSAAVSDLGDKDPNHIEVDVKLVSIDPNKGDIVARLEFLPKGHFTTDDGGDFSS